MELDALDRKIVTLLQQDGRMSNAELAERVNLSQSACLRRVRRLEEEGVVQGYVMLVNQAAIGLPLNVFVEISLKALTEEALDAFEAAVRDCPAVMASYLMSGDADYLLHMAVADAEDYERLHRNYLSRFPYVSRIRSSFALRTVSKKTAFDLGGEAQKASSS
jgi:Lrp/AsnC family leucine-responsive transcriptional regulator